MVIEQPIPIPVSYTHLDVYKRQFQDILWPDYGRDALAEAVAEYHERNRRFGGVDFAPELVAG